MASFVPLVTVFRWAWSLPPGGKSIPARQSGRCPVPLMWDRVNHMSASVVTSMQKLASFVIKMWFAGICARIQQAFAPHRLTLVQREWVGVVDEQ